MAANMRGNSKNMSEFELGAIQTEFAELIWEKEPVSSGELVKL